MLIELFRKKVMGSIEEYVARLNLPAKVGEEAKAIAEKSLAEDIAVGYRPQEVAVASIYIACRRNRVPLSFRDFLKATRIDRSKFRGLYKKILLFLGVEIPVSSPEDYLYKRLAPLLGASDEVVARAKEVLDRLRKRGYTSGKNPGAVAAAALYVASLSLHVPMKISRLAKAAGVTSVTIKNNAKTLMKILNLSTVP